jgi:hypothetical protein
MPNVNLFLFYLNGLLLLRICNYVPYFLRKSYFCDRLDWVGSIRIFVYDLVGLIWTGKIAIKVICNFSHSFPNHNLILSWNTLPVKFWITSHRFKQINFVFNHRLEEINFFLITFLHLHFPGVPSKLKTQALWVITVITDKWVMSRELQMLPT